MYETCIEERYVQLDKMVDLLERLFPGNWSYEVRSFQRHSIVCSSTYDISEIQTKNGTHIIQTPIALEKVKILFGKSAQHTGCPLTDVLGPNSFF